MADAIRMALQHSKEGEQQEVPQGLASQIK
jgi:hypothetical protein